MDQETEDILLLGAIAFGIWWFIDNYYKPSASLQSNVADIVPGEDVQQLNKNYLTPLGRTKEKTFMQNANYLIEYKIGTVPHTI